MSDNNNNGTASASAYFWMNSPRVERMMIINRRDKIMGPCSYIKHKEKIDLQP